MMEPNPPVSVGLIRRFLLSVFCQSVAIPTDGSGPTQQTSGPQETWRNVPSSGRWVKKKKKTNGGEEEAASCSVTVSLEGHQLFIKPVREWSQQQERLNGRSQTGPHLPLGWFGGSYWLRLFFVKWPAKAQHWAFVWDIKFMFAC